MARLFEIDQGGRAALRSRLRNLQKLGLAPSSPGSGKRRKYTYYDACDLALALSLAEFGVDPRFIVKHIKPGTVQKLGEESYYCGYAPHFFSKGESDLFFRGRESIKSLAGTLSRIAIINMGRLKSELRVRLRAVAEETYVDP